MKVKKTKNYFDSLLRLIRQSHEAETRNLPSLQMNTHSSIAKKALVKLFKPVSIINASEQTERNVVFPKEAFDIYQNISGNAGSYKSHAMAIHSCGQTAYYAWSIEIGLVELSIFETDNFAQVIVNKEFTNMPTHIIKYNSDYNDFTGTNELYSCYRVTPKQTRRMMNAVEKINNFKTEVLLNLV